MESNAQHVQHKHQMHDQYTPSLGRASSPGALVSSGTMVSCLPVRQGPRVCTCVFVYVSLFLCLWCTGVYFRGCAKQQRKRSIRLCLIYIWLSARAVTCM